MFDHLYNIYQEPESSGIGAGFTPHLTSATGIQ
jgi:hypothetical protein